MQNYIIVDTETTCENTVADFAAVVCDAKGKILDSFAVLVLGEFDRVDLFYLNQGKQWSRAAAEHKRERYNQMIDAGDRVLASRDYISRRLQEIAKRFNPILTAYNLAFDVDKCRNTAINLDMFSDRFCLWHAAASNICNQKKYRRFVLENHLFNAPTEKRNMTFQTNAEAVFGFINGTLVAEPHTALEDARDFELPILQHVIKRKSWLENTKPYTWQDWQVNQYFKAC